MYDRRTNWNDYLARYGFKDTVLYTLDRKTSLLAHKSLATDTFPLMRGFGKLIANHYQMRAAQYTGFSTSSYALSRLRGGMLYLQADFDWAAGGMLWRMDMQYTRPHRVLRSSTNDPTGMNLPGSSHAQRAHQAYCRGHYDDALALLHQAEQHGDVHFVTLHTIATITLYHHAPADLPKAYEYYHRASVAAEPYSNYYAALGALYAAFVAYLQGNDDSAIEQAQRATAAYPDFSEAWYSLAKFAAAANHSALAIPNLQHAIHTDRHYAIKARADADFEAIEDDVAEMITCLYQTTWQEAEKQWQHLCSVLYSHAIPENIAPQIDERTAQVEELLRHHTYFSSLDALTKLDEFRCFIEALHLPQRDNVRKQTMELLTSVRTQITHYTIQSGLYTWIDRELAMAEHLLAAPQSHHDVLIAQRKVHYCQRSLTGGILNGHTDLVYCLAFSPDSMLLASGSADHTVRLWDVASATMLKCLSNHTEPLTALEFSPNGKLLASASSDMTIGLYSSSGQPYHIMHGHTGSIITIAFSPDSAMLASGASDYTIRLWSTNDGSERATLRGHTHRITALVVHPNGTLICSGSSDTTIRLWDLSHDYACTTLTGHSGSIRALAISPDGRYLASASSDMTIGLWDIAQRSNIAMLRGHNAPVKAILFNPNGRYLASASSDTTVRLWDIEKCTLRATLAGHTAAVNALSFSPHGLRLVSASSDTTIRIWSVSRGEQRSLLSGHRKSVNRVLYSPNGVLLASAANDATVRIWSLATTRGDTTQTNQYEYLAGPG